MKKGVTLMFVVVFIFAFYLGTVAAPNLQEVKVNIDYDMKMYLHGQPFNPVDKSTGISYRPIIYKNKIYLPAKDVCDASKLAIDYDPKGNVLNIGEKAEYLPIDISLVRVHNDFGTGVYLTKDLDILYTPQKTYKWGLTTVGEFAHYWSLELLTNGKYTKFKGSLYNSDKNETETVEIHAEKASGEIIKVLKVDSGKTIDFEVDIQGINILYIKKVSHASQGRMIIGEPQFK